MKYLQLIIPILLFISCSEGSKKNIGLMNNQLQELDDKPHGVSTLTKQENKRMDAISYTNTGKSPLRLIKAALVDFGSNEIITETENYLHCEFSTTLGFTDDVEFYIDTTQFAIHFLSESRVGHTDFGTNRKRMEKLSEFIKKNL